MRKANLPMMLVFSKKLKTIDLRRLPSALRPTHHLLSLNKPSSQPLSFLQSYLPTWSQVRGSNNRLTPLPTPTNQSLLPSLPTAPQLAKLQCLFYPLKLNSHILELLRPLRRSRLMIFHLKGSRLLMKRMRTRSTTPS